MTTAGVLLIMLCMVVLTFDSVDEIIKCKIKLFSSILSHGPVYLFACSELDAVGLEGIIVTLYLQSSLFSLLSAQ